MTYNIRFGGTGREQPIAAVIRSGNPDVVVLEEATDPAVVKALASSCGMKWSGSIPGKSVAFLSRVEVKQWKWHSIRWARRDYLELAVAGFRIYGVHLSAVHSNVTEQRRLYELEAILSDIKNQQPGFHIVTGDFNTLAPEERLDLSKLPLRLRVVAWLTGGRVRYRTIQRMLDAGYVDVFRKLHPLDSGLTFPTWGAQVRLDFYFAPKEFAGRVTRCEVLRPNKLAAEASDHYPVIAEIEAAG
jgi:exodeoxyribonuclease-3